MVTGFFIKRIQWVIRVRWYQVTMFFFIIKCCQPLAWQSCTNMYEGLCFSFFFVIKFSVRSFYCLIFSVVFMYFFFAKIQKDVSSFWVPYPWYIYIYIYILWPSWRIRWGVRIRSGSRFAALLSESSLHRVKELADTIDRVIRFCLFVFLRQWFWAHIPIGFSLTAVIYKIVWLYALVGNGIS